MILHPIIDLLKRIVVALPDYAGRGGGGELPESITAIDGGEFIPLSDIQATNYTIYHSLGVKPKYISLWTNDTDLHESLTEVSERYLFNSSIICDTYNATASNTYNIIPIYVYRNTTGNASNTGSPFFSNTNPSEDDFYLPSSSLYLKAGITYKWIVYA